MPSTKNDPVTMDVKRIGGAVCGWAKNKPKSPLTDVKPSFDVRTIVYSDI